MSTNHASQAPSAPQPIQLKPAPRKRDRRLTRRQFLRRTGEGTAALAVTTLVPKELFQKPKIFTKEDFTWKHFVEMTPEEVEERIRYLEELYRKRFKDDRITIATTPAKKGVLWGYALNIGKCIGCRRCVKNCVGENNQSRDPQIEWIRVLEIEKGTMELDESHHYYDHEKVPDPEFYYMPVQCQQCENPPCVKVCPTTATWQEPDGIVVVDYNWCIGCRFCLAACPYFARRFNWQEPTWNGSLNPNMHYLGNRPRFKGVMEKCTFCIQRSRAGRYTACVEACPVGARKFGNLLDPNSEIRRLIATKRVFRLKEEAGTHPKFFYFID
ncbi:MAG: 4Fe-4S dicluster domain-containing protein [Nitrospirae bacterium]|nr:MAG: 4Fe-4S dicluster domain-containing protein [Nitrospirota bacterium]